MRDEETKTVHRENPAPRHPAIQGAKTVDLWTLTRTQGGNVHPAPPGQREQNLTVGFYTDIKTINQKS